MIRQKTLAVFVLLSLAGGSYASAEAGKAADEAAAEKAR